MGLNLQKSILRKQFLAQRKAILVEDAKIAAEKAANNLIHNLIHKNITIVAIYLPVQAELDTIPLKTQLQELGLKIALPKIVDKNSPLVFKLWDVDSKLISHPTYKVKELDESALNIIPDIVIVPLLAFDEDNHRLGYGGGYYDRTIKYYKQNYPHTKFVGYAYEGQKIEGKLPRYDFDQMLDFISLG